MAKLQRHPIAILLLFTGASICLTASALGNKAMAETNEIVMTVSADRALTLRNTSKSPVNVGAKLVIEQATTGTSWDRLDVQNLRLRSRCGEPVVATVAIPAGASLTALPWTGRHCASQCTESCRAEMQYPAGQYRYVVKTADGVELRSPAFTLSNGGGEPAR